ncbi:reductase [Nesidiocoris tenuis]|uniref:Reductase n=1 Tax=Nesidiocoris tenuis TaxID=355587 RepID=A0ABN7B1F2_9HEMI|nr:reductase [Nesidiocoris tenuis]
METLKFNNGLQCPIIGLGTYQSKDEDCLKAVKTAIDAGYRHIDTALYYQNEKEIGLALAEKIAEGVIKREDIFLTTKLWNTFHRPDLVEPALDQSLKDLKTDYVDLYLIHWPVAFKDGWELSPKDEHGKMIFSDADFVDTWRAMESLVDKRKVKSIGLSNFNKQQVERILSVARIKPVTNQIEVHPYLVQRQIVDFCHANDIVVTAYRPLGGPPTDPKSPAHDLEIANIAKTHDKTLAQIMLRFLLQRRIVSIPKSANSDRIRENIKIFDFELDDDEMKTMMALDKGKSGRSIPYDVAREHKDYPFDADF